MTRMTTDYALATVEIVAIAIGVLAVLACGVLVLCLS
jgi:hypothetical protein